MSNTTEEFTVAAAVPMNHRQERDSRWILPEIVPGVRYFKDGCFYENGLCFPESDGQPIAESTVQYDWIDTIKGGISSLYDERDDVFVAADLIWYPNPLDPAECAAPDTMVVFGRPKGHRPSYFQWHEGDIGPQVVFEVQSKSNTADNLRKKLAFYNRHGVEEYYLYNPDYDDKPGHVSVPTLSGWLRDAKTGALRPILRMGGWVSPRLGIRFVFKARSGRELKIIGPDGRRFVTYSVLNQERKQLERDKAEETLMRRMADQSRDEMEQERNRIASQLERTEAERETERRRAVAEQQRAESERLRAESERLRAEEQQQRAEVQQRLVEEERRKREQLEARLRALGIQDL